jgi:hypothetical protein
MQARPEHVESNPTLAGEVCGVTGAAQELLHLARPVFLLDLDQGLEFAQVMGIAQGMKHARHRVIGLTTSASRLPRLAQSRYAASHMCSPSSVTSIKRVSV